MTLAPSVAPAPDACAHAFTAPPWCSGLAEVVERLPQVDAWVVDQFGVLHDGRQAYPGAADALRRLVTRGDPVIVLSNSGKRNAPNEARLAARGFDRGCYTALLTSGELTHRLLAERRDPFFAALGPRCWLAANDGDTGLLDGLPLTRVARADEADLVILAGMAGAHDAQAFDADFAAAVARGVPAVCANPDLLRLDGGTLAPSSGALAQRYEALGGTVRWIGKPHADVYAWCRATLAALGRASPAMLGDSLLHDVAGAQRAGWRTVLVAGGLHRDELLAPGIDRAASLQRLCAAHGLAAAPDAVIDQVAWRAAAGSTPF